MSLLSPKSPNFTNSSDIKTVRQLLVGYGCDACRSSQRYQSGRDLHTILWLEIPVQHLTPPTRSFLACTAQPGAQSLILHRRALIGPMTVVQCKRDLEKHVPDLVFRDRGAGSLCFADDGAEVAG